MPPWRLRHAGPLVLFDIDGTLIRRAGEHHRQALVEAIRRTTGLETTTEGVPVAGMLDPVILAAMMHRAGLTRAAINRVMPAVIRRAQSIYLETCPDLQRKVCPGVRRLLRQLEQTDATVGLVTGNLTRIAWRKMEQAGLRSHFRFGAFAESARDRAGLVRLAIKHARKNKWVAPDSPISLIGDHINDIEAARANSVRAIAVATGVLSAEELAEHSPDLLLPDLRALRPEMIL